MSTIPERRLAAIMFTDIIGYTSLMGSDEEKAFKVLRENREIHRSLVSKYGGVLLKEMGDGILCSFLNSSDAVRCAGEIQFFAGEKEIPLRIGIHQGEVVFQNEDILGDGVNVASRLEQIAKEKEIIISESIFKDIKNKTDIKTEYVGKHTLKNVKEPVNIYKVQYQPVEPQDPREKPMNEKSRQQTPNLQKRIPYFLIGVFLVALTIILVWFNLPERAENVRDKSIIVLPFKNDSPDQENEYFCNGMMEEILTNLQNIQDLRVKSRASSEMYRYRTFDITEIGRNMHVGFVLEGSVRKVEDNLRITAQLIDAETGDHLWAETYDGKYTNKIFEFQSRTARAIANSLKAIITPEEEKRIERIPTTYILAYDLSLKGHEYVRTWTYTRDTSKLELARILADEALQIDPEYIGALDLKALISMYKGYYDSAMYFYNRISRIDPDHAIGYSGKGYVYMRYLNNMDSAFKYLVKGVRLAPNNPWTNLALAQIYSNNDEIISSLLFFDRAYALDGESSPEIALQISMVMATIGDYPNALKYMKKSMKIRTECVMIGYYNYLLLCQKNYNTSNYFLDSICEVNNCGEMCNQQRYLTSILQNNLDRAQIYLEEAPDALIHPIFINDLMYAYYFKKTGREDKAQRILTTIIDDNLKDLNNNLNRADLSSAYWMLSGAYSLLNDKVKALHYLSKLEEFGFFAGMQDFIMILPAFENLWDDPQFMRIMKSVQDKKTIIRGQIFEMQKTGELNI